MVTATASFWTPSAQPANPTYLVLTAGDTITVNGVAMQRVRGPFFDVYTATLQPAETYTFTFTRTDGTSYDSTVNTIVPLEITSPADGAWISRAADLNVTWTNPIEGGNVAVFVPGSNTLTVSFVKRRIPAPIPSSPPIRLRWMPCLLNRMWKPYLSVSRSHKGVMATGLAGNIVARTGNNIAFVSTE